MDRPVRWICAQIGAREHYAVARAFHRDRVLERLYTDFWTPWLPGPFRLRGHPELPAHLVTSFAPTMGWRRVRYRRSAMDERARYREFVAEGRAFSERVRAHLDRGSSASPRAYFGYSTGALATLPWLTSARIQSFVCQIDPARTESEIVTLERQKFPAWEAIGASPPEEYFAHLEAEWALADRVIVNSRWSFDALVAQGVPASKLAILPLAFEPDRKALEDRPRRAKLRVLFLGQVILRKGIQYLVEAARALRHAPIEIRVVGPLGVSPSIVRTWPSNIEVLGALPRTRTDEAYAWADVFVLPTLSDGFALTQLEAMAHGVPVITTPRCGDVVTHGIDGLIVPAGDAEALAAALEDMIGEHDRIAAMSRAAVETSRRYSLRRIATELGALVK